MNRTLNKKLFARNIGFLNDEGAIFGFDLIFALPGDTFSGFCKSIDFALSLYPNNLELFCLSVLPGTTLSENAAELGLTWQNRPPYQVTDSTTFPARDIEKARSLSSAVNLFYTAGRAVPWFLSVLKLLKMTASAFFMDFEKFLAKKNFSKAGETAATAKNGDLVKNISSEKIEELQKDFVSDCYKKRHLERFLPIALDLITFHSSLSRCTADGKESTVALNYDADDLASPYASDLRFFFANIKPKKCKAHIFPTKNGSDWRIL